MTMNPEQVKDVEEVALGIALRVLEAVILKHAVVGRHEINRTNMEDVINEIKMMGLKPTHKPVEGQIEDLKNRRV